MIKNEREYRITKAQAAKLERALAELSSAPSEPDIHPLLAQAERDGLESQLADLKNEVAEYEALQRGETSVIEVDSFEGLPIALIKARIAAGLTQRDLAERLGLKEQQIQRYEATEYASASLGRVNEVVQALGLRVHKSVFLPNANVSVSEILARLRSTGIERDFVLSKLVPRELAAELESQPDTAEEEPKHALKLANSVGRVFGWSKEALIGPMPLLFHREIVRGARFKMPARSNEQRLDAYAGYAYYLATVALRMASEFPVLPVPTDPAAMRTSILESYGTLTFRNTLRYVWKLGIPVLPLRDRGVFHGACWRTEGRNVIVLKQRTLSTARWLHDLFHEVYHAGQEPELPQRTTIETGDSPLDWRLLPEERAATRFASEVVLDGRAEELAQLCVKETRGNLEWLKNVVPRVAAKAGVRADALANYMAFRLSLHGQDWWATATTLQAVDSDPWKVARDVFLEHANFTPVDELDRKLLERALSDVEV